MTTEQQKKDIANNSSPLEGEAGWGGVQQSEAVANSSEPLGQASLPPPSIPPREGEGRYGALEEKIIERIRTVFDPEIPVNLYDLGLIYKIELKPVEEGKFDLAIDMTLTAPNCPVAGQMPGMVQQAVINLPELNDVDVQLVFKPPWDKSRMSDEARLQLNMF